MAHRPFVDRLCIPSPHGTFVHHHPILIGLHGLQVTLITYHSEAVKTKPATMVIATMAAPSQPTQLQAACTANHHHHHANDTAYNHGNSNNDGGHAIDTDPSHRTHQQWWQQAVHNASYTTPSHICHQPPLPLQQQQQRQGACHQPRPYRLAV